MDNSTTFQGDGKVVYIPVVVNGKQERRINADRFRAMSDMEIASFFYWDVDGSGRTQWQWLEWLRKECDE